MKLLAIFIFVILTVCGIVYCQGPGSQCPSFCPLNYAPVCGFNGRCYKVFSNDCALKAANCGTHYRFQKVNLSGCSGSGARLCST